MAEERITVTDDAIIVDNPGARFHLLQIKHALRLEINTGMRHSKGSVMELARSTYGIKARTKIGVLNAVEDLLKQIEEGAGKKEL